MDETRSEVKSLPYTCHDWIILHNDGTPGSKCFHMITMG